MKTTIAEYKNNCVLVAFKRVSNISDSVIIHTCQAFGFKGHGMQQDNWLDAARVLGIKLETVYDALSWHSRGVEDTQDITIGQFTKKFREGTFLVRVKGHLLTVHDGKIIDPNYQRRAARRRVYSVYRVMNSTIINTRKRGDHLPKNPTFYFVNMPHACARRRSAKQEIYLNIYSEGMNGHMRSTLTLDGMARYGYTRKMLRSDLRKGNIALVD